MTEMVTHERGTHITALSERSWAREEHVGYFRRCLEVLSCEYQNQDTNRMTIAFFCLSGLDLLGAVDELVRPERKQRWTDWIYAQQILPDANNPAVNEEICGFRGSPSSGLPYDPCGTCESRLPFDAANLAMTYTALCCLLILGDDLSRVNRIAIVSALRHLQKEDGSFIPTYQGLESDARFVYCAIAVSYILNDFGGVNVAKAVEYLQKCQSYECGFGQGPGQESHGGSTYCAVASLYMCDALDNALINKKRTIFWLLSRQSEGFHGRPNKPDDTCYSFWIGASLQLLGAFDHVNFDLNRQFLMTTQAKFGGFSKWPGYPPDVMHSYLGIAGLALMKHPGLTELDPLLNISMRTKNHLLNNTVFWKE